MGRIILCRGIQGSGKSTWARQWVNEDPEHRVRFNNDDIRNMLGPYWVPQREPLVSKVRDNFIINAMDKGYDIVIDNMNLNPKEEANCRRLINLMESEYDIEYKDFFDVSLEECIRRDSLRPNPIGEKVIRETYERYKDILEK